MDARLSEIGPARGLVAMSARNAFELAAANILQILALGRGCGGFVKIDGDLEAFRNLGSDVGAPWLRQSSMVTPVDRNEGHDIGCAHAWVRRLDAG